MTKNNQMKDIIKILVQQLNKQPNDPYTNVPQIYKDIMADIMNETEAQRRQENAQNRPRYVDEILR